LIAGTALGFSFPPQDPTYPQPWRSVSGIVGWIYFMAWSISFYPQVFINARRKSVVGLSFEYPVLNLLGFTCYSVYNSEYFWNSSIRADYARTHSGEMPSVQSNDVFFGLHAVLLTLIILWQITVYDRGQQTVATWCWVVLAVLLLAIVGVGIVTGTTTMLSWLDYLVFLSYVKLAITLMKYTPQAVLNWQRQSTVGWSIENILLDFTGGMLSLSQSLLDNGIKGEWNNIMGGNPAKFFLGFTSMVFDIIFMVQHYYLYAENNVEVARQEAQGGDKHYAQLNGKDEVMVRYAAGDL
jgi:cystinosin